MVASEFSMKQISEDLKGFLTKDMENNAKKIRKKITEKMDTKFDELSNRTEAIDRKTVLSISLCTLSISACSTEYFIPVQFYSLLEFVTSVRVHLALMLSF